MAKVTVITDQNGSPWWVAKEVCDILGYSNTAQAVLKHVKPHQKNTISFRDGNATRGNPNKVIVNEGGLYRLVMRSKAPSAEVFQDWVTDEVLPRIRKSGGYIPVLGGMFSNVYHPKQSLGRL